MVWRGELADAVAEVEDVRWPRPRRVGVRHPKALQHLDHLGGDLRRWGKQHVGVDVALQGLVPTHLRPGLAQVDRPVGRLELTLSPAHPQKQIKHP